MQTPLVSIIIPTYNRAHLIGETLDSVLAQTYTNWECIVVDDGSTDSTDEVLNMYCNKDARFQYHYRPSDRPKGANSCRNYGFELSKGEYVNWFDDDDLMLEDFLMIKTSVFTKENDLVICSGYIVNELLQNKKAIELNENPDLFKDYVLWKLKVLTPSILFRKIFLINKDLFSNKIKRGQETELFSRLFFKLSNNEYQIIKQPLFLYRQHSESKTFKSSFYVDEFKESIAYCHIENFKRSLLLKDEMMIYYLYKKNIKMLFSAIKNKHKKNINYILGEFKICLSKKNIILYFKLYFIVRFLYFLGKPMLRFENHFKYARINN